MAEQPIGSKSLSNLTLRIMSAAVLAPLAILSVWAGGLLFAVLVIAVAVIGFWEWTGMSGPQDPEWTRGAMACAIGAGLLMLYFRQWEFAAIFILTPMAAALLIGSVNPTQKWAGIGMVYVIVPAVGLLMIRADPATGLVAVIFILLVVWATDIAAYFGGRTIGGPKLWPRISPNKTWSGGLSGLAAALIVGAALSAVLRGGVQAGDLAVSGVLSVFSQAGDFLESAVKRKFGVKDSGTLIPGHGGVLDRVDGVLGAAAIAFVLVALGLGGSLLPALDLGLSGR